MDSSPIASSSKTVNASNPPEGADTGATGVGAASGTELAISSDHPLENGVVIDRICSFLPGKELLNCRLVNKQWNSSSIRQLKSMKPFNRIDLRYDRSMFYLAFINSRDKKVEWYQEDIKYKVSFGRIDITTMENLEFSSAQQIIDQFGPDCLESVSLAFPKPKRYSATRMSNTCALIRRILHQTNLEMLTLRLYGSEFEMEMVAQIVNSANSIHTLIFEENHFGYEITAAGQRKVLLALQQMNHNVLDSIKQLEIKIPGPSSFEAFAEIMLPKLKHLKLGFSDEGTQWSFPEDWQHFQNFINVSCSSLATCDVKFDLVSFITEVGFLESFSKRNINFVNTFPRIEFKFVTPWKPSVGRDGRRSDRYVTIDDSYPKLPLIENDSSDSDN